MKYCVKCGNSMEDDMMFCQKCGTKFEGMMAPSQSVSENKVANMKKYNLVIYADTISWNYLREDGERAGNIFNKQDKLCLELVDLIKDILCTVSDDERDLVEREVYTYVLQMGYKMCKEAQKMYSDYSGFQELFEQGHSLVKRGLLEPSKFLNQMIQQDGTYKGIVGVNALHCSRIVEVLDSEVIYNNQEYRKMTIELARAYDDMWTAATKRYTKFFMSPGQEWINMHWDYYNIIIKGLPISEIDKLDESGWILALDDQVKNQNGAEYKRRFLDKRDKQRSEMREKEQKIADKKYWESHPEEFAETKRKQESISEIRKKVHALTQEKVTAETEKNPLDNKKDGIQKDIDEKQKRIEKLEKKIFGKKKAEEEIEILKPEIEKTKETLQEVNEQIQKYEKVISDKDAGIKDLEQKVRVIEQEIEKLRNK